MILSLKSRIIIFFGICSLLSSPIMAASMNQNTSSESSEIYNRFHPKSIKTGDRVQLWIHPPGSEQSLDPYRVIERSKDKDIKDRAAMDIVFPALTVYKPEKPNGIALLVMPGGGYQRVVLDKEAAELAPWLNDLGITYFVLEYRLQGNQHSNASPYMATQDAQRAIRLIRSNALNWGLKVDKVGVMGFSAGGHVASSLAVKYDKKLYPIFDEEGVDDQSARPDFLLLGYPVITMKDPFAHKGSRLHLLGENPTEALIEAFSNELQVTEETPPTFIFHASDDKSVPVENSILFYQALQAKKVPAELHLFQDGGHGFSIRFTKGKTVANWTLLAGEWIKSVTK